MRFNVRSKHQIVQAFLMFNVLMFNVYRFISTTVNAAALTSALQTLLEPSIGDGRGTVGGEGDRGDVNFYSPERAMMRQTKM